MCTIAIGNDHTAVPMRGELIASIRETLHCEVIDHGTASNESTDYPHYAVKVARDVLDGKSDLGVLICGTGVGISIAANKIKGIRCALCYKPEVAEAARRHNNANILAFGARTQTVAEITECLRLFLREKYEEGRHQRRLDIIRAIEDGSY